MIAESFYLPEVRCDYQVTERQKKIWAVELNLLEQFDLFCRKYNIQYFAGYGTLLGAVRHQGFIPWDNDIDVVMFRPEYERLKSLNSSFFHAPFSLQFSTFSESLELVSPFAQLHDDRTSAVAFPEAPPEMSQGIFIDIFPLDSVEDGSEESAVMYELKRELWCAASMKDSFMDAVTAGNSVIDREMADSLCGLPADERLAFYETYCLNSFENTEMVDFIPRFRYKRQRGLTIGWDKNYFKTTEYLPFEHLQIPVPSDYDPILRCEYGNYTEFVRGESCHEDLFMDPDRPYLDYLEGGIAE